MTCVTIYLFTWPVSRTTNKRTYVSDNYRCRFLIANQELLCLSCVPVIVGAITIWTAPWHPTIGPLIGYYLVAVCHPLYKSTMLT